MNQMQKYIYIISLLSLSWLSAQDLDKETQYQQRYGFRVGVDISKPIRMLIDKDNYFGWELLGDFRINYRFYVATEVGMERKTTKEDFFTYKTDGQYIKLGIDYNTYGNWYGMENIINVGGRYAFSYFSQDLKSYSIYKTNQYWEESTLGDQTDWLHSYEGRTGHWLELLIGVKAELFRNLFLGFSLRIGYMVLQTNSEQFPNYWIPGFGRLWESSRFGASYNYGVTYLIPFYKKTKKVKE